MVRFVAVVIPDRDVAGGVVAKQPRVLRYAQGRRRRRCGLVVVLGTLCAAGVVATVKWVDRSPVRQEIEYQIGSNLAQARDAVRGEEWANAQIAIDRARLAADCDPTLFFGFERQYYRWRIDREEARVERARERAMESLSSEARTDLERRLSMERQ